MNGISNGDGTYKPLSDSDALVGKAEFLPNADKSVTENIGDLKTEINGKFNIPKIDGSNFKFYTLTSSNIDNNPSEWSIGMGLWGNQAYISFNFAWIYLQFRINSSAVAKRFRFGNSSWGSWTNF